MRLLPSDPDIGTIVTRINNGDINLQPDFQRGEVWSTPKKQRLIDSIMRDWHIPPIHVIELKDSSKLEVLDGQQRLVAIRDFVNGEIFIDGNVAPFSEEIQALNGLDYKSLPNNWRRRFDQFTIRMFKITDYLPQEPGELFFRLNQPASLTSAEQRNAFYGEARGQIKSLVELLLDLGISKEFIGFSNSRMAYDDIIARLCFSLEIGDLLHKVTSIALANRYRFDEPFNSETIHLAEKSIYFLGNALKQSPATIRFNKATLYSWLWFVCDNIKYNSNFDPYYFAKYIDYFERLRNMSKAFGNPRAYGHQFRYDEIPSNKAGGFEIGLMQVYNDRASARVADVSSVLSRDLVIWTLFVLISDDTNLEYLPANHKKTTLIMNGLHNFGKFNGIDADNYVSRMIEAGWNGEIN
ncbi:DUF262 domain-containing protein [Hymenobacter monticola]|uniref:DUF262 domain-containing protein n=1 Tax=Hymenobacter monticola TaxID=1705399 RepID=A0ABY4BDN4_9BACT|nr:DUF262 domain-containing protein [Hymenobacter monticola]UOE36131.1 DUF262 domain-containing protein [Hymenobacter monticola]